MIYKSPFKQDACQGYSKNANIQAFFSAVASVYISKKGVEEQLCCWCGLWHWTSECREHNLAQGRKRVGWVFTSIFSSGECCFPFFLPVYTSFWSYLGAKRGGIFGMILSIADYSYGCIQGLHDRFSHEGFVDSSQTAYKKTTIITTGALKTGLASLLWYLKRFQFLSNLLTFNWNWETNQIQADVNQNYHLVRFLLTSLSSLPWHKLSNHFSTSL